MWFRFRNPIDLFVNGLQKIDTRIFSSICDLVKIRDSSKVEFSVFMNLGFLENPGLWKFPILVIFQKTSDLKI